MSGPRYKTRTVRSVLKPRWWQLVLRARLWRYRRRTWREWNALPPEARASVDVMRRRIDAQMFFGEEGRLW